MKTALAAACAFTLLACSWLFVMFFVLRHPGFIWRAAVTLFLMAQSAGTLVALRGGPWGRWWRSALAVGAAATSAVGVQAFLANEAAADWEGYIAIISIGLIVQGVLTLVATLRMPAGT